MSLAETPRPTIMPGMILVETKASVVSAGTERMIVELARKSLLGKAQARPDLVKKVIDTAKKEGIAATFQKVQGKLDNPIPLGYSCAGIVRQVGMNVERFQSGDYVACGGANYATHAEYNLVPQNLCVSVPRMRNGDTLPFEEAAFATVGAIALQGVRQADLLLGENVCVIGLGLLGQLTVQLCKANGCRVIGCDIDANKLLMGQKLGIHDVCLTGELEGRIQRFTRGVGADAVIITASTKGNELIALAGEISRMKGRVVAVGLIGLDVPRDIYYKKELDLRLSMSYGPGRYDVEYEERGHDYPLPYVRWTEQRNMEAFLDLVAAGAVNASALISHRYRFEDALSVYKMITGGKEASLGVILQYEVKPEPTRIIFPQKQLEGTGALRLGVIGAGNFAKSVLLPRLKKNSAVSFRGIVTAKGATAKTVGEKFGFSYCSENVDEVLSDKEINTVMIATRHNLHGTLVKKALEEGKNVFVEKPLCLTEAELNDIIVGYSMQGTHESASPFLMVGFNRRFSPFIQRVREIVKNRSIPLVASYRINAGLIPKNSWVQDPVEGGGRVIGEVCHFIDTMRFLFGTSVRSVQAKCIQTCNMGQTSHDSVSATLSYEDGSLANILYYAQGNKQYPKEKLEIACDDQTIVIDDYRTMEVYGSKKERKRGAQDKGFDAEIEALVNTVIKGGLPPITFSEIIETTLVTFAINDALNTGETVSISEKYQGILDSRQ
ncbi:MAG: bi-domain-containing oxidoreductase [Syntrophorhabdaceae bacterium]|nr:bi-domain-containing oxidoreductase [Syntrophorhabdaceae bacterium]